MSSRNVSPDLQRSEIVIEMDTPVLGIDEAGRGCVIGPMVLVGVRVYPSQYELLTQLGLKDSKKLSPKRREQLTVEILAIIDAYHMVAVPPPEIDRYCNKNRLNLLEAEKMVEIIKHCPAPCVYLDAPGRGGRSFGNCVRRLVADATVHIIAENHADQNYPVVSAASILAKVFRDRAIDRLRAEVGDFGSGYPSDGKTRAFLRQLIPSLPSPPPYIRQSWKTITDIRCGTQEYYV